MGDNRGLFADPVAKLLNRSIKNRILLFSMMIFTAAFLISRLPYFLYYRVILIHPDSSGYYMIVDQINKGFWPIFSIRTPGYPLFLKLVFMFFSSNFAVAAVQHGISFATGLFFIWVMAKVFPRKAFLQPLTALAFSAFVNISWHIQSDSSYMTDSLHVNALIIFFAFLVLGLHTRKPCHLALSSFAAAAAILIRPAGLFLLAALALGLVFMVRNSYGRRLKAMLVLPCAGILSALMVYNALTIHSFTVSAFTEHALISFASTFLEPDPAYGPTPNKAIAACRRAFRKKDLRALETSLDFMKLNRVFKKYYENNRLRITDKFLAGSPRKEYLLYLKWRPLWRRMAFDAIRKHPRFALKYFYSSMMMIFYANSLKQPDFYDRLRDAGLHARILPAMFSEYGRPGDSFNRRFNTRPYSETLNPAVYVRSFLREYAVPNPLFNPPMKPVPDDRRMDAPVRLFERWHRRLTNIHTVLFRNPAWVLAFLIILGFATLRVLQTGFRHTGAFILFLLTFSALIYWLMIAFFSYPYPRYTYVMEFISYLSPFIWPIALSRDESPVRR